MGRIIILCLFFIFSGAFSSYAQLSLGENSTLKGLVFGDFFWISENHNSDLEGENGFWFRRIYVTLDTRLSESFSSRFRLEMNSEGDFTTNTSMIPDVKDAYLKWTGEKENHEILAGISGTPTWGLVEDVWGFRSVEKTPLDLQRLASSRDFGIAAKGELGNTGKWNYHVMIGNGNSNRNELNRGKKFMTSLSYKITENIVVEGYGDFNSLPDNENIYTGQLFTAYRTEKFNLGLLYAHQVRKNALPSGDLNMDISSIFTNFKLTDDIMGLFRVDHVFDPNPRGPGIDYIPFSSQAESTFFLAGVDILMEEKVHLIPNIEAVVYGEDALGVSPDSDLIPRITLFYKF